MEATLWKHIQTVKSKVPLVHSITNYVVMNNTANALLAAGASPIMAHAKSEVKDMVALADTTVINIGTLDEYWSEAMLMAAETADLLKKPWVMDPVGAGASPFRDDVLKGLLAFKPTVIKGNASEIIALAQANQQRTKGVDSTAQSTEAIEAAQQIAIHSGAVVCVSGAKDIITNGNAMVQLDNGSPLMGKVTGMGCTAAALIGAFIGTVDHKMEAVSAAMSLLGIAGELAAQQADGPGSLQVKLLDKLHNISETEFKDHLQLT